MGMGVVGCMCACMNLDWGGDVAQLVRALDHYAADSGSIPGCGKVFFSQSQLSVQTLLRVCPYTLVYNHMH